MEERTSKKTAQGIVLLVVLIMIMVVVIVSLLSGDRAWVDVSESPSQTGTVIIAGDPQRPKETEAALGEDGSEEEPFKQEIETSESVTEETTGRSDSTEDQGDPQSQDKELEGEGSGAKVTWEESESQKEESSSQETVTTLGIDVSKWQGKIDWQQVAGAGVDFAIIRVGFRTTDTGEIKADPYAAYNLQHAAEAGIQLGAYFFSTAVTEDEAREEARWTVDFLAGYPITYPVAYNCEGFLSKESRMYGIDIGRRTQYAMAFLEEVERSGYEPMFHASKSDLTDGVSWDTARIQEEYPVWVAQYPSVPYPKTARSTYYGEHTMWQYTSQGTVPGIQAHVDVNVAYFAYATTAKPKDPGAAGDAGDVAVDHSFQRADEMVTAKDVTNLRTEPSSVAPETVVAQLQRGQWVHRTGISAKGWSQVEYQGQTLYAVSSLLLTEEEYQQEERREDPTEEETPESPAVHYQSVQDRVTAKEKTNLRDKPTTEGSQVVATIVHGEVVHRIAVGSNGWSRVIYNGQVLYAVSSYLVEVP